MIFDTLVGQGLTLIPIATQLRVRAEGVDAQEQPVRGERDAIVQMRDRRRDR